MLISEFAVWLDAFEMALDSEAKSDSMPKLAHVVPVKSIQKVIHLSLGLVRGRAGVARRLPLTRTNIANALAKSLPRKSLRPTGLAKYSDRELGEWISQVLHGQLFSAEDDLSVDELYSDLSGLLYQEADVEAAATRAVEILRRLRADQVAWVFQIMVGQPLHRHDLNSLYQAFARAHAGQVLPDRWFSAAMASVSDAGLILQSLATDGANVLGEAFGPRPGYFVSPMEVELFDSIDAAWNNLKPEIIVGPKYDGFRYQLQKFGNTVFVLSHEGYDRTGDLPDVVAAISDNQEIQTSILDAEIVAFDFDKQRIRPRSFLQRSDWTSRRCFLYDVMLWDNHDVRSWDCYRRRHILEEHINAKAVLACAPETVVHSREELDAEVQKHQSEGAEGTIVKDPAASYMSGARSIKRGKIKKYETVDAILLGYNFRLAPSGSLNEPKKTISVLIGLREGNEFVTIANAVPAAGAFPLDLLDYCDKNGVDQKPATIRAVKAPDRWLEPTRVVEVKGRFRERSELFTCNMKHGRGYRLDDAKVIAFRPVWDKGIGSATSVERFKFIVRLSPGHFSDEDD